MTLIGTEDSASRKKIKNRRSSCPCGNGGTQRVRGSTFLRQGREPGFNVCVDIASRLVYALGAPGCGGILSQNTGVVRAIKEKEYIQE